MYFPANIDGTRTVSDVLTAIQTSPIAPGRTTAGVRLDYLRRELGVMVFATDMKTASSGRSPAQEVNSNAHRK